MQRIIWRRIVATVKLPKLLVEMYQGNVLTAYEQLLFGNLQDRCLGTTLGNVMGVLSEAMLNPEKPVSLLPVGDGIRRRAYDFGCREVWDFIERAGLRHFEINRNKLTVTYKPYK